MITTLARTAAISAWVFQSLASSRISMSTTTSAYLLASRGHGRRARMDRVAALLELVQFAGGSCARRIHQLSGGSASVWPSRVASPIDPKVFLLDEPLSALDGQSARAHAGGTAARLQTAPRASPPSSSPMIQKEALTMAASDVIRVMNEGKVQQAGAPMEIYRDPANAFSSPASFGQSKPAALYAWNRTAASISAGTRLRARSAGPRQDQTRRPCSRSARRICGPDPQGRSRHASPSSAISARGVQIAWISARRGCRRSSLPRETSPPRASAMLCASQPRARGRYRRFLAPPEGAGSLSGERGSSRRPPSSVSEKAVAGLRRPCSADHARRFSFLIPFAIMLSCERWRTGCGRVLFEPGIRMDELLSGCSPRSSGRVLLYLWWLLSAARPSSAFVARLSLHGFSRGAGMRPPGADAGAGGVLAVWSLFGSDSSAFSISTLSVAHGRDLAISSPRSGLIRRAALLYAGGCSRCMNGALLTSPSPICGLLGALPAAFRGSILNCGDAARIWGAGPFAHSSFTVDGCR